MLKKDFLESLKDRLIILDYDNLMKTLEYYSEAIDDRMEDGLSEDEAIKALGPIDEIVRNAISESKKNQVVEVKKEFKFKKLNLKKWQEILLWSTCIIWVPLLFSLILVAFSLIFTFYVLLWSLLIALIALNFSLGIGGVAVIIGSFGYFVSGKIGTGFYYIGGGLLALGLATLLVIVSYKASKLVFKISKNVFKWLKKKILNLVGEKDE